ncbi:MAG: FAD-dependent oxidoreductase [Candidatus Babeliaceae bacterium]|jgi:thioredoxin reductase (NADPH)
MKNYLLLVAVIFINILSAHAAVQEQAVIPIVVIGSGPAGLTAAIQAARLGYETLIVAGPKPGGQLTGASAVENVPAVDVLPGIDIIKKMEEQARSAGAEFLEGSVTDMDFSSWPFVLTLDFDKKIQAYSVIIATGSAPRRLGIPGESHYWGMGVSSCAVCDGFLYTDKKVAIIGGGDSAIEHALNIPYAQHITIFVRKSRMRAMHHMQERIRGYDNVSIEYNKEVLKIIGDGQNVTGLEIKDGATGDISFFPCDGVFVAIGHNPNSELFKDHIQLAHDGYIYLGTRSQQTSVPGVFAAGDVADSKFRQVSTATGTAAQAGFEAVEFLRKNHILDKAHRQ